MKSNIYMNKDEDNYISNLDYTAIEENDPSLCKLLY